MFSSQKSFDAKSKSLKSLTTTLKIILFNKFKFKKTILDI